MGAFQRPKDKTLTLIAYIYIHTLPTTVSQWLAQRVAPRGGSKSQFCDFANKIGRESKKKPASRGLSAVAELLVLTCYWLIKTAHVMHVFISSDSYCF